MLNHRVPRADEDYILLYTENSNENRKIASGDGEFQIQTKPKKQSGTTVSYLYHQNHMCLASKAFMLVDIKGIAPYREIKSLRHLFLA